MTSGRVRTAASSLPLERPPLLERVPSELTFVGRERERRLLGEAWTRAVTGRRQLVLLGAEAGMGKTRLSLEFARACADERAIVMIGRCDEEALIPYQPFVEALAWFARACPESDLHAALEAAGGGAELGAFVPDLLTRVPGLPRPTPMNAQGQRYRLFETVRAFLAAASQPFPILLLIDDLHWADKPTLSLLRHVVRGSDAARLCIVSTYREDELGPTHPLTEVLADLRRERDVSRIALPGLAQSEVRRLVETLATPDLSSTLARKMTDSTGGNPFFVGEMLRHLQETGALAADPGRRDAALRLPAGVREVISRRVSRLSDTCRKAMTLASVLGQEFQFDVLQPFSEINEEPLLDAVDDACRAQLVDEVAGHPGRYSFHHALIRDTLYGEIPASRRVRHHRRAGEILERLSAGRPDSSITDLAYHFCLAASAGVADKAIDYATRAGDRMATALAHEEATRYYDLALSTLDTLAPGPNVERQRVVVQRRRGHAAGNLGLWGQQRTALQEALARPTASSLEERCEMLSELCQACFWLFDIPSLERASTEALSVAEQVGREDVAANALGWLARCRQAGGEILETIETDRSTIARFGVAAHVSHSIGSAALYWAGRGHEAVAVGERAVQIAETWYDATSSMNSMSHLAISLAGLGRYRDAAAMFARARDFGRKYGALPLLARVISMSAGFRLALGDWDGAEAIAHEARELAQRVNFPPSIVSPGIDLLLIAARRGEPGSVETLFDETVAASQRTPGWHGWLWNLRLCQVRAELASARGDWVGARVEAIEAIAQSRRYGRRKYEVLGLTTRAEALMRLGRRQEAIVDARLAISIARAMEDPALGLQTLDLLIRLDGDDTLAAEARTVRNRIFEALPDEELGRRVGLWPVAQRIDNL
jgi:tetratricopeptide (TPR) repeat protein